MATTMRSVGAVAVALSLAGWAHAPVAAQTTYSIDDVDFLAGCWIDTTSGGIELREQWTEPVGGVMMSTTRFLRGGEVVDWEFGRIVEEAGVVTLWPYPKGVISEHGFPLVSVGEELVFENPEHDFPIRIIYARVDERTVHPRIEGSEGQVIAWELRRTTCPG